MTRYLALCTFVSLTGWVGVLLGFLVKPDLLGAVFLVISTLTLAAVFVLVGIARRFQRRR